jgi:hypothetical protein
MEGFINPLKSGTSAETLGIMGQPVDVFITKEKPDANGIIMLEMLLSAAPKVGMLVPDRGGSGNKYVIVGFDVVPDPQNMPKSVRYRLHLKKYEENPVKN